MRVEQLKNGNVAFIEKDSYLKVFPSSFHVHQHPRVKDSILISDTADVDECLGWSIGLAAIENINSIEDFTDLLDVGCQCDDSPKDCIDDTRFSDITHFDQMVSFCELSTGTPTNPYVKNHPDGRIQTKEYQVQLCDAIVRVTLTYYYFTSDPQLLSHIIMSGNVSNIELPLKAFHYLSGRTFESFEELFWTRY